MFSIVLKGIPAQQKILKIPTASLADSGAYIPAVIGTNMAKNTLLKQGDTVTLRWRDIHGAFNAADIVIKQVMDTPDLDVDVSQVWIDLSRLQTMKDAPNRATFIMLKNSKGITYRNKDWTYQSIDDLMADLRAIVKLKQAQAMLIYAILLFLAMIAIFDTQVLAVFKRRKEIGTFAALGMTTQQIIRMFTLEGMMYAMLASLAAAILGMPLFVYYGTKGWKLPGSYDSFGIAGFKEPIIFHYSPATILLTFVVIMLITTLVSWIPTLKIARLKPTDALRGRAG
jgi:ABC-type antimicrobial peptide transport system permease subunit